MIKRLLLLAALATPFAVPTLARADDAPAPKKAKKSKKAKAPMPDTSAAENKGPEKGNTKPEDHPQNP